jgi:hypothetical protein
MPYAANLERMAVPQVRFFHPRFSIALCTTAQDCSLPCMLLHLLTVCLFNSIYG